MPSTTDPLPEGSDELTSWVLHRLADPVTCDAFFKNLKRVVEALPSDNRFYVPTLAKLGALVFDLPTTTAHNDSTSDVSCDNSLCDDDLPTILPFLSTALLVRYIQSDDPADLEESVRLGRKAAAIIPPKHAFRSESLSSLSNALRHRFDKSRDLTDLDEAIEVHRMNVEATPDGHPGRSHRLTVLGHELAIRFERTSNERDLNEMVEVAELAENTATTETGRALKRSNWGYMLNRRFDWLGDLNDLQQAINLLHLAINELPNPHAERWRVLNNLSYALIRRFEHLGDRVDVDAAIDAARQAAALTSDRNRPMVLVNLGNALKRRFQWFGDLDDINQAIDALRNVADCESNGQYVIGHSVTDLAYALRTRFEWTRERFARSDDLSDLEEAISLLHKVTATAPDERPSKSMYLENLMLVLRTRFEETGDVDDLNRAIAAGMDMVRIVPENHRSRSLYLHDMADVLMTRFKLSHDPNDIDLSVRFLRQSVAICQPDHPQYDSFLSRLGIALLRRARSTKDHTDLDSAVTILTQVAEHMPQANPHWAVVRLNLSDALHERFNSTDDPADLDAVIRWRRTVAEEPTTCASDRVRAAAFWGLCAATHERWPVALDGYLAALRLLPLAAWQGARRMDREEFLAQWSGLAPDAAACAIAAGEVEQAVTLLEQGRGVLWSQLLETRRKLSTLQSVAPKLASRMMDVREALDAPGTSGSDRMIDRRTVLAHEWDDLVTQVRALPGFESFLQPHEVTDLRAAAVDGPVVVINVSRLRCDALIVTTDGIEVVPLPNLTATTATENTNRYLSALHRRDTDPHVDAIVGLEQTLTSILEWLWDTIAEPVLTSLGYTTTPDAGTAWPRLWWCPTGGMTLLPLHAAGRHGGPSVLDRAISSYTSTLRALMLARTAPAADRNTTRILVVAMPTTFGTHALPSATRERDLLTALLPAEKVTVLEGVDARRAVVRQALDRHQYVHFVCHGEQNLADPFLGGLHLDDGRLTVAEFGAASHDHGEFAFLGACQTAVGGVRLPEEVITMVAALQCAGWRRVIGTLWPVGDRPTAIATTSFYTRTITDGTLDPSAAPAALHHTVRDLRDRFGTRPSAWAPFVYAGP